jgi:DNA replication protein DnaC
VFVTWPDLLNHMRQGFRDGDYDERVEAWRSVPVLAIDEYGRAKESEWVAEAQVLVLNHRHESALHKKTVTLFASNFAPDSERVDDWLYDRLRDQRHQIVKVTGPSLRPVMKA